ncbi:MAG: aminoacyl-tRNA hydrolase [Bryobacteraceae bacterium]|nr:aminoacyl-tRNA hydrolase [Bryobacteraceae bacterium]
MCLVVGLGNPGRQYEDTPHNLGFLTVDRLAGRHGMRISRKECLALTGEGEVAGRRVILAKPQTYMNRSGLAVRMLLEKYGLEPRQMLVIYDDLDLPWRMLRIRPKGSAGGHHGMESVGNEIGTTNFARLRLGIAGYRVEDGAKFVLARFGRAQKKQLDELLDLAAQAAESVISEGVEKAMARFNRRARGETKEEG